MPRIARVVIADVAHHVTQRGNGRQFLLSSDTERLVYLDLLRQVLKERQLSVLGYCLMSNHVPWVVTPRQAEDLAWTFQQVHGRYAAYWNAAHAACGHVWQGRFYSCPMDASHLWTALRYVELNPVRAGMVKEAVGWRWSSAAGHCGTAEPNRLATAAASSPTGNATYNLTFSYTQDGSNGNYGNMTCVVNGHTQGLCPNYTLTRRITRSALPPGFL